MLKDQLLLIIGFQNHGILVEALDASGEFNAAHQVDGEEYPLFTGVIKKRLLNVLRKLIHFFFLFIWQRFGDMISPCIFDFPGRVIGHGDELCLLSGF